MFFVRVRNFRRFSFWANSTPEKSHLVLNSGAFGFVDYRFAGEEVPAGKSCSLTGILQYDDAGKGRYLLKLRDENDCMY